MGGQHSSCTHPKSKCYHAGSPRAQVVRVEPPELTTKQKQLLKTAWECLERDIADVGIITFLGMFETHPQVQDIFMPFVGLAKTDETYSKTLRQHALRVMATVEKCIHRLDEPERMRTVLEALGARHINYNSKIEYVDVLGSQFVKAVKENSTLWNDDMENAWLSLVRIITFYVKHGWMDKQKQQVTREVTRKEYLNRLATSKGDPASKVTNPPTKQANGRPPPPRLPPTSPPPPPLPPPPPAPSTNMDNDVPTTGMEPRPTENGGTPGGHHLDSRSSQVTVKNSTSTATSMDVDLDQKPCGWM